MKRNVNARHCLVRIYFKANFEENDQDGSKRHYSVSDIVFVRTDTENGQHMSRKHSLCRGSKNVSDLKQKHFFFVSEKQICFRNICFPRG